MTSTPTKPRGRESESSDPLERLAQRLRRARSIAESGNAAETTASDRSGDPLDALEARIREASDPAQWAELLVERARFAPEPLASLLDSIGRARIDTHAGTKQLPEPNAIGLAGAEDPLEELARVISAERDEIGARREPLADRQVTRATSSPDADSAIAGELLSALAAEPLSGEARAEAARRLADIADNPSSRQVREVLRLLVHDGGD